MVNVQRMALVSFSAQQMFDLVQDVDAYHSFLPWCDTSQVIERQDNQVTASLGINHGLLKHQFSTRNTHVEPERIDMELVEGPFQSLSGTWRFEPLGTDGCKISLDLNFKFAAGVIGQLASPIFQKIANNMVDAFCQQATKKYG